MTVLFLLLAAYGVCFGLMNEKWQGLNKFLYWLPILRDPEGNNLFARMFACSYCTGFHTGWMVWLIARVEGNMDLSEGLLFAFASSAFCYTLDIALRWLER